MKRLVDFQIVDTGEVAARYARGSRPGQVESFRRDLLEIPNPQGDYDTNMLPVFMNEVALFYTVYNKPISLYAVNSSRKTEEKVVSCAKLYFEKMKKVKLPPVVSPPNA
jgi:hypothetical protein